MSIKKKGIILLIISSLILGCASSYVGKSIKDIEKGGQTSIIFEKDNYKLIKVTASYKLDKFLVIKDDKVVSEFRNMEDATKSFKLISEPEKR